jgi:hypothetical protein
MWMLDTDYNGLCFVASQVFFPKTAAWDNLKRSLGAVFDDSVWEHLAGTSSTPPMRNPSGTGISRRVHLQRSARAAGRRPISSGCRSVQCGATVSADS